MRRLLALLVVALTAGVFAWAEYTDWRASHRRLGTAVAAGGSEAVVVLGFRNRSGRANAINRYRVRVGLRSMNPEASSSVLVLCGGTVAGDVPEAELLARYARERGYRGEIRLDTTSTTTWENIRNAIPLIGDAETIIIASHSQHAEAGREYLWTLRPDLAARLVRGKDYRFGEIPLVKPIAAYRAARHRAAQRR